METLLDDSLSYMLLDNVSLQLILFAQKTITFRSAPHAQLASKASRPSERRQKIFR